MGSKTAEKYEKRVVKKNRELKYVKLSLMKVNPVAQRVFRQPWADHLLSVFDLDRFETPTLNFRDGSYYICNGQHSIDALKRWLGNGWEDQYIECWVYTGLTEAQEADKFLALNYTKPVDNMSKFKVSLTAGYQMETEINNIVVGEGLYISPRKSEGSISSVGTLEKVFIRDGAQALRRAIVIARDAYGSPGLIKPIIDGLGMFAHRYNGVFDDSSAIAALSKVHGGMNGLLNMAESYRQKFGSNKSHCVAAAAVHIINRGRTGKNRLANWWKE